MTDWAALEQHEAARYRDGEARLGDGTDERQRQLTRMGNAAWGAGLCRLMQGADAREWLDRAAGRWRESYSDAPPGSWGRPIGAVKAFVLVGDPAGAEDAVAVGARRRRGRGGVADRPVRRGARVARCSATGRRRASRRTAIRVRDDFPRDVADALATIAAEDVVGYVEAVESVLASFESRDGYLEDIPVADTVLVLQALAARRNMAADLTSDLLP